VSWCSTVNSASRRPVPFKTELSEVRSLRSQLELGPTVAAKIQRQLLFGPTLAARLAARRAVMVFVADDLAAWAVSCG